MRALLSSGLVLDNLSVFFSEEVLKSTPPRPRLGAGTEVAATEEETKPPRLRAPPNVDCPKPVKVGLEKRLELKEKPGAGADEVVVAPPKLREKPVELV